MSEQLHEAWAGVAARQAALIAELQTQIAELQAQIEAAEAAHAGDGQPHKLTDALIAILRKHGYEPKR